MTVLLLSFMHGHGKNVLGSNFRNRDFNGFTPLRFPESKNHIFAYAVWCKPSVLLLHDVSPVHCYLSIYTYNKIVCTCVCECALLQENCTTYNYQISYEDSKTPEYVHLRLGFPNFF